MNDLLLHGGGTIYRFTMLSAFFCGAFLWSRTARKHPSSGIIYFCAFAGALLGAKIAFFLAEGIFIPADHPKRWIIWLTGKSVTGALLGGYAAVEASKKLLEVTRSTGDRFAVVAPLSIAIGRLGCISQGCCNGIVIGSTAWPAAGVEAIFNLCASLTFFLLRKAGKGRDQLFHIYLIIYGIFRFFHEFLRFTPKLAGGLSGYQWIALILVLFGIAMFRRRSFAQASIAH